MSPPRRTPAAPPSCSHQDGTEPRPGRHDKRSDHRQRASRKGTGRRFRHAALLPLHRHAPLGACGNAAFSARRPLPVQAGRRSRCAPADIHQFPPAETKASVDAGWHPLCRCRRRRTGALTPRRHVGSPSVDLASSVPSALRSHQELGNSHVIRTSLPRSFPRRFNGPSSARNPPTALNGKKGMIDDRR